MKTLLLLALSLVALPAFAASQLGACEAAAAAAEARYQLPAGLLGAIGLVESGRGALAWPWTINAVGMGQQFDSKDSGLERVRALQSQGITSIDVGCFQINLFHHPQAFGTLEQAFEPSANADYAARFLQRLAHQLGSWEAAVSTYHSAIPALGEVYRTKVYAALGPARGLMTGLTPDPGGCASMRFGARIVSIWTPVRPGVAPSIISIERSLHAGCREAASAMPGSG